MSTCPECQTDYSDGVLVCEKDGAALVDDSAGVEREIVAGDRIGEYDVESKLGEGGFGSVYRAVHPLIGKTAAIKVLARRFSSDREMESRFVAEARAVNQIKHKNIIDIFSFGRLADGRLFFVMELLEGVTLDHYLAQFGRMSVQEAIPILLGVARALDAAHAAGIVHRDLKPENVFLAHDEDQGHIAKLLDFGIAKLFRDPSREHQTRTGVPMGTPQYMSPEQCRGHNVDHRTDVYSFGVLAYRMLTGRLPFSAETAMDVMMMHVQNAPPPASERAPGLPSELDAPLGHMLKKAPEERPASVLAALEELGEAARRAGHDVQIPQARSLAPRSVDTALASAPTLPILVTPLSESKVASGDTLARATTASVGEPASLAPHRKRSLALVALVLIACGILVVAFVARRSSTPADAAVASAPATTAVSTAREPAPPPEPAPASSVGPAPSPVSSAKPVAEIALLVESQPADVEVYLGDQKLGVAPGPLRLPRGTASVKLVLRADGYAPREVALTPSANRTLSVKLKKLQLMPAKPAATVKKPEVEF